MSKATREDLARRIRTAQPMDKQGRYDAASKVEVKAFVAEEVEAIEYEIGRIPALEARIAELELSLWARFKRWFNKGGSMGLRRYHTETTITIDPPGILKGEELGRLLKQSSDRAARVTGKPPELAAPYGKSVEMKQGEGLSVKVPLAR